MLFIGFDRQSKNWWVFNSNVSSSALTLFPATNKKGVKQPAKKRWTWTYCRQSGPCSKLAPRCSPPPHLLQLLNVSQNTLAWLPKRPAKQLKTLTLALEGSLCSATFVNREVLFCAIGKTFQSPRSRQDIHSQLATPLLTHQNKSAVLTTFVLWSTNRQFPLLHDLD